MVRNESLVVGPIFGEENAAMNFRDIFCITFRFRLVCDGK